MTKRTMHIDGDDGIQAVHLRGLLSNVPDDADLTITAADGNYALTLEWDPDA